jgi:hypothetical protein
MRRNSRPDKKQGVKRWLTGLSQGKRKSAQKRNFFRIIYPASFAPKILNTNYRVIDLSSEGIKFVCPHCADGNPQLIKLSSTIDITLQFHNEEKMDLQIKILRCYNDDSDKKYFAALILTPIPVKKIMKEDAYIRRYFPDF